MSVKGQTHNKRAREFALKEKRERKKAKKEDRRNGIEPPDAGAVVDGEGEGEPSLETQPEPPSEWVQ
jgi:hypothetical protein